MAPLIQDGFVIAVDFSETHVSKLSGKIAIPSHKDLGLTVSRLRLCLVTRASDPVYYRWETTISVNILATTIFFY
jgi:hypothetical protein